MYRRNNNENDNLAIFRSHEYMNELATYMLGVRQIFAIKSNYNSFLAIHAFDLVN